MAEQPEIEGALIPARTVRTLCGDISDTSLWRWLNNDRLGFPKPTVIQKRRYWREREIRTWLERQGEAAG